MKPFSRYDGLRKQLSHGFAVTRWTMLARTFHMHTPMLLSPAFIKHLLEARLVFYDGGDHYYWLGRVYRLSEGQRHCWQVLWNNFTKGNLPIHQGRVLAAWYGESTQASDLLRRHAGWKTVIVGDRHGHLWLHIPDELLETFRTAE